MPSEMLGGENAEICLSHIQYKLVNCTLIDSYTSTDIGKKTVQIMLKISTNYVRNIEWGDCN